MHYHIFGDNPVATFEAMQYDLLAKSSIAGVYDGYLPWSNASLRPAAIQLLFNEIMLNRRTSVIELGSGLSTVLLSAFLAERGGRLVSIDHDQKWQEEVATWIPRAGTAVLQLVHAPLAPFAGRDGIAPTPWYDAERIRAVAREMPPLDLVIVDGPPAFESGKELARLPALEVLQPYLADSAAIVLDDIMRSGEKKIGAEWSRRLGLPLKDLAVQCGLGVWRLGSGFNVSY